MLMSKRFQTERNIRALKCAGLREPRRLRSGIRVGRKGVEVKGGRCSGKEGRRGGRGKIGCQGIRI